MKKVGILTSIYTVYTDFLRTRENGLIGRQKLAVYIFTSLVTIVSIALNMFEVSGPQETFYKYLNWLFFIITAVLFTCYIKRFIKLHGALSSLLICAALETAAELIYCAFNPTPYHLQLIVANMTLFITINMLAITAYMKYMPYISAGIAMGAYFTCVVVSGDPTLANFSLIWLLIFTIISALGSRLIKNVRTLEDENIELKDERLRVMRALQLNKEQVMALAELSDNRLPDKERVTELLDIIGNKPKRNLVAVVSSYLKRERTEMDIMENVFTELTYSEREICRLILQDMKIGAICDVLSKSESNITSQRTHIRAKLGLQKGDNLKKVLKERIEDYDGKQGSQ